MEIIQDKLFIANMQGTVTIYSLPVINKIGAMLHKNTVNSIVPSEYITKTNIKIPQVFVLESKYNDKNGSIAVYTIKNWLKLLNKRKYHSTSSSFNIPCLVAYTCSIFNTF